VSEPVLFHLNGKKVGPKITKGYAHFQKKWQKNDKISISIPMPVRKIVASEQVESDRGKMAYQRGPLLYCFEDKENNEDWMFDLYIPKNEEVHFQFEEELLGGIVSMTMNGFELIVTNEDTVIEQTIVKAIPYYTWNTRGPANMLVWMPVAKENVFTKSGWSKEMEATSSSSLKWIWGLNTGFDPKHSGDIDKIYYYFWQREGSEEWVQYDFVNPVTLSESRVYWLNLDHYDGNYRVPESWSLMVQDDNKHWMPVVTNDPYRIKLDKYNTVTFQPVETSAIRMKVKLQKNNSAGILSWKVK
jgi:hypothetical protein